MLQNQLSVAWESVKSRKSQELRLDTETQVAVNYLVEMQLRKITHTQAGNKTHMIICGDNEAVIKICLKGRSQALRHLHRTHRVAVDLIYDMIKANWVILEHVNTKVQIADIFTKPIVKSESWLQLTDLAQIRAVKSGRPPVIDLAKKPKKKKVDSNSNQEQVSPSPKAKPKKKSAKKKVAAALVLSATAVNLIGCQLLTLSRVDGLLGISVMRSFAQAPGGAYRFPLPCDGLCTPTLPPLVPATMARAAAIFRWQNKAQEQQDRLGGEPLRSIAEERERQQMFAVAEGGVSSDVGDTPVVSGSSPAPTAHSPWSWLGGTYDWLRGKRSDASAETIPSTSQMRSEASNQNVDDEGLGPGLRDTSASGPSSSRRQMRNRLGPNVRENLQRLDRKQGCIERPPIPPVPAGGVLPEATPLSEKPLNIPTLAWYKCLKTMIDLTNNSEGCFDGKLFQANAKATRVMTLLNNLTIITSANFERDCFVGNNRLLEMIAAIDTNITAFKPPSIPTDWQANQLAHHEIESPYTVYSPPPT